MIYSIVKMARLDFGDSWDAQNLLRLECAVNIVIQTIHILSLVLRCLMKVRLCFMPSSYLLVTISKEKSV